MSHIWHLLSADNGHFHRPLIARSVELCLGAVVLSAALLKVHAYATTVEIPHHSDLLVSGPVMLLAAAVELLLGSMLVGGVWTAFSRRIAVIFFTVAACAAFAEALRHQASCGCFGRVPVPPWITAWFDVLALTALVVWQPRRLAHGKSRRQTAIGAGVLLAAVVVSVVVAVHRPTAVHLRAESSIEAPGGLVLFEPEDWVGKSLPVLNEIENSNPLRFGRWLVVFYHYDCDSCPEAIPRYQAFAVSEIARNAKVRMAFIAMPPVPVGADPIGASSDYMHLGLRPDHDWFATTPVVVALDNGRVIEAREGEQAVEPPEILAWRR